MKTVSTKLDSSLHQHLIEKANREGTTVSDFLRDMVYQSCQEDTGKPNMKRSGKPRIKEIQRLESEVNYLESLLDKKDPRYDNSQLVTKMNNAEDTISDLISEEYHEVEGLLMEILENRYVFSRGDVFLKHVKEYDVPVAEALDDAMELYLKHVNH
jgi:uncharacterized membrane protein YheB (UPF0754 family)